MNRMRIGLCAWCMMPLIWQINSLLEAGQAAEGLPCLFRIFTGLYCPGCGGTRAVKALLSGQILKSLYFHPFVLYMTAALCLESCIWIYRQFRPYSYGKVSRKEAFLRRYRWWAIGGLAVVLINWIVKNGILLIWEIELMP